MNKIYPFRLLVAISLLGLPGQVFAKTCKAAITPEGEVTSDGEVKIIWDIHIRGQDNQELKEPAVIFLDYVVKYTIQVHPLSSMIAKREYRGKATLRNVISGRETQTKTPRIPNMVETSGDLINDIEVNDDDVKCFYE